MHFRSTKKLQQEVSLNESIGQDKEGNVITFIDVIENDDVSIDEQIDLKMKVKKLYELNHTTIVRRTDMLKRLLQESKFLFPFLCIFL